MIEVSTIVASNLCDWSSGALGEQTEATARRSLDGTLTLINWRQEAGEPVRPAGVPEALLYLTWSNETYGHQAILLKLTTSGTVAEPTWPAGMTRIGSGAWVTTTATVNYVHAEHELVAGHGAGLDPERDGERVPRRTPSRATS